MTDMMKWLSSLPDVGSTMDVDEGNSTFVRNSKDTENNSKLSLRISTKQVEVSLRKKCKGTRKKALEKAADPPVKDYTNNLNQSCFMPPVSSPECERAAKGVIPAHTRANSNWLLKILRNGHLIAQQ